MLFEAAAGAGFGGAGGFELGEGIAARDGSRADDLKQVSQLLEAMVAVVLAELLVELCVEHFKIFPVCEDARAALLA